MKVQVQFQSGYQSAVQSSKVISLLLFSFSPLFFFLSLLNYLFLFWYVGYLKASVTFFSTFVTTMALAWAFAQLDYQSSIMANEGTQTRSRQLEEQVRAMRESMDKIQADLAERMQQQSEEFQAQKQLQQQQFEKQVVFSIF